MVKTPSKKKRSLKMYDLNCISCDHSFKKSFSINILNKIKSGQDYVIKCPNCKDSLTLDPSDVGLEDIDHKQSSFRLNIRNWTLYVAFLMNASFVGSLLGTPFFPILSGLLFPTSERVATTIISSIVGGLFTLVSLVVGNLSGKIAIKSKRDRNIAFMAGAFFSLIGFGVYWAVDKLIKPNKQFPVRSVWFYVPFLTVAYILFVLL